MNRGDPASHAGAPRCWLPAAVAVLFLMGALIGATAAGTPSDATTPARAPARSTTPAPASPGPSAGPPRMPVLAYYYQWFTTRSWERAKIDYPRLGRYSSDQTSVIREHIRLAQSAGITGFIVSWKDTGTNDRRLELLMSAAKQEHFTLAMIYQGLDFNRRPLPVARVEADMQVFARRYAPDPVFSIFSKPLVIWSGIWMFSRADVARVSTPLRRSTLLLATEKDVTGYARIADLVDGDAYYWSSVNPRTNSGYPAKLAAMSAQVHRHGGLWIAPFAPGFDARLVGGSKQVDRQNGATLRIEYNAAVDSSPDALGLISWNEFSENTYVEPSQRLGDRSLTVLRELIATSAGVPGTGSMDSSDTPAGAGPPRAAPALITLAVLIGTIGLVPLVRRRMVRTRNTPPE